MRTVSLLSKFFSHLIHNSSNLSVYPRVWSSRWWYYFLCLGLVRDLVVAWRLLQFFKLHRLFQFFVVYQKALVFAFVCLTLIVFASMLHLCSCHPRQFHSVCFSFPCWLQMLSSLLGKGFPFVFRMFWRFQNQLKYGSSRLSWTLFCLAFHRICCFVFGFGDYLEHYFELLKNCWVMDYEFTR